MPDLVALDLPAGDDFVDALRRVLDAGDAVTVVDRRLPPAAQAAAQRALAPTAVLGADLERRSVPGGRPVEQGDAVVLATSGSEGEPKGVVLTAEAIAASAAATSAALDIDEERDSWLACLPMAHIGGLSVVLRALWAGTGLVTLPGFDAAEVQRLGSTGAATHVSLVPTALGRLADPGAFSCILLGGAAPRGALPANAVTTYGMTETGSGVVYDGRPLAGVEVAIGDGRPGCGEEGEILLRAPMVLRCYRDGAEPFVAGPDGAGGWLLTGDAGRLKADGTLAVDGRLAEVVNTGGEKVWPAAVERLLARHPGVDQVAVWKRPDPEWGERVVAWVVPEDPGHPPGLEDLRGLVAEGLAPWAAPRQLEVVASLPRTASGKVRRRALS